MKMTPTNTTVKPTGVCIAFKFIPDGKALQEIWKHAEQRPHFDKIVEDLNNAIITYINKQRPDTREDERNFLAQEDTMFIRVVSAPESAHKIED